MASASLEATGADETPEFMGERAALRTSNRALLTVGVMAATIMQILDSTIANVALPHMQASLGATSDSITWVLTSYIVASAVAIPMTGWLADRVGSRRLFLTCVVGFVLASMLCGLATSLPAMVGFRVLQGVAAAFMNPLSQTVMLDINPPSKQASAMSVWGMGVMVGPIMGPVIGGWLTENYDWRWVFYVNVPIGIACFAVLWALLPSRPIVARRFDLFGFSMLALAISSLQVMLDRGTNADWFHSTEIWVEAGVSASAAWMFVAHMMTAKAPMFPRALFANRNLVTGIGFMLVVGVLMMATMALLPPMLQSLFGYPVLDTGLLLVPRGVGIVMSMYVAGRAIGRGADPRLLVGVGLTVAATTLWIMTGWTLEMGAREFVWVGFVQGLGLGMIFIPLNIMSFATLPPSARTEGSSLLNLSRNIGGSVGISLVTALLGAGIQRNHEELAARLPDVGVMGNDPLVSAVIGGASDTVLSVANGIVNEQAAMIAYLNDFKLMMVLTACALPLVLVLKRPTARGPVKADADAIGH